MDNKLSPPPIFIAEGSDFPNDISFGEDLRYSSPSFQHIAEAEVRPEYAMHRGRVAQQLETLAELRRLASPTKPIRTEKHRARVDEIRTEAQQYIPDLNKVSS
jgi:hypothetical protein